MQLRKDPGWETVGQHRYPIIKRFNNEAKILKLNAGNALNVANVISKLIEYATVQCEKQMEHVGVGGINKEEVAGKYSYFFTHQ